MWNSTMLPWSPLKITWHAQILILSLWLIKTLSTLSNTQLFAFEAEGTDEPLDTLLTKLLKIIKLGNNKLARANHWASMASKLLWLTPTELNNRRLFSFAKAATFMLHNNNFFASKMNCKKISKSKFKKGKKLMIT